MKTYSVQLREYCAFDLKVSADSLAEAIEKTQVFYAQHRKPETMYAQDGLIAELAGTTVRTARRPSSQSGWASTKTRTAARDSHRDAVEMEAA